jgi:hypothetical protein
MSSREVFKSAIEVGLEVRLRQVFGVSTRELVRVGRNERPDIYKRHVRRSSYFADR